jgi:CRISPR/Cas system CSM-associated protein Csm2 small subunit
MTRNKETEYRYIDIYLSAWIFSKRNKLDNNEIKRLYTSFRYRGQGMPKFKKNIKLRACR